jgi:putative cell wall-binding protein
MSLVQPGGAERHRRYAPRPMARLRAGALVLLALLALGATSCGKDKSSADSHRAIQIGAGQDDQRAAQSLGFPQFATKNTTRVGGADPAADAAAVAQAVYNGRSAVGRPLAVVLVDGRDWSAGLAASQLMADPLRAPVLLTDGDELPQATKDALAMLRPLGSRRAGGAQVIRINTDADVGDLKTKDLKGNSAAEIAKAIDDFQAGLTRRATEHVVVASAGYSPFALPAAGWAAKSGDPVLYVTRDSIPPATKAAIQAHQQPRIYVLGPESVISETVAKELRRLGTVTRIQGPDPVQNSIAFARFLDGRFGWGVVDPGHGLVFVNLRRPADAAAASPLSASGKFGPLLVLDRSSQLPKSLESYLLDIQPGYQDDPVRGVYNHAWLIGDGTAISLDVQARIDSLLEIVPVTEGSATP